MFDNVVDQYESDGDDYNPKAHKKLLTGVSRLQKSQFIKKATRDEPVQKRNEFNLVKLSNTDQVSSKRGKIDVNDLVNVLDKTSKNLQLGKGLKKTTKKKKVLPIPLQKPAAEKLKRAINYVKIKEKLERWDAVVAKNRTADHLSFPLLQEASGIEVKVNANTPSKFSIKSDMMREMEKIEPQLFEIKTPNVENDDEEPELTRKEIIQRSRELRQLRIKESQKSIKSHHQNKIKSKKFHRILKKEKMRQQIKEFELLQKTDPEAALRKIEQLDRSRVEERGLLRHRNTGTWAKNLQVRAKYDKEARKDLADQIATSRELTAKKNIEESDDDEDLDEITVNNAKDDPFDLYLGFKKQNQRANEDEELNGDDIDIENFPSKRISSATHINRSWSETDNEVATKYESKNINPDDIAQVKSQHLSTALPDTIYTNSDDGFNEYDDNYHFDEKKMTIAEAFEDDDVVTEFQREKDEETKKNGPQEIDLSLPGWGSWGGNGIDPTKQKTKRKLVLRFPAPEKRRVDNQGNLVMIENKDERLQKHLVANLPFPFTSVDEYEKSIRCPIGSDFVPATANRVLTKPAVTTKSGTIIDPMNENMLINKQIKRRTKTDRRIAKIVSE